MQGELQRIQRINNLIDRIKNHYLELSKKTGDSYYRNYILYILENTSINHQKEICTFYGLPKTTVNGVVLSLEKEGCVTMEQDPTDKRAKVLALTEKGYAAARSANEELEACQKVIAERMPAERLQLLESALNEYEALLSTGIQELKIKKK